LFPALLMRVPQQTLSVDKLWNLWKSSEQNPKTGEFFANVHRNSQVVRILFTSRTVYFNWAIMTLLVLNSFTSERFFTIVRVFPESDRMEMTQG